jgi:hypothetical protein
MKGRAIFAFVSGANDEEKLLLVVETDGVWGT